MNLQSKLLLLVVAVSLTQVALAQQLKSSDYYAGIKEVDASRLWHAAADKKRNDSASVTPPEPLGFIGDHYQRFYIHYTTVVKNKTNRYQYIVHGKTKVKDQICNFTGTITIVKAGLYKEQADKRFKQGFVECVVDFSEDSTQKSAGSFKGKLTSKFYLDKKEHLEYDDILLDADGYYNNQCEATWTAYGSKISKKVNWGDYRIPASKALDSGDGEFAVNKNYLAYGWQNYAAAWSGDPENESAKNAQLKELAHWWE